MLAAARNASYARLVSAPRILVVDDNPELLTLLSSAFEEAGYVVQKASRGRTALDLARKEKPALAVLDVLLPDLMGYEVAEALKRLKVPFVFMSGVHKGGKAADIALHTYDALAFLDKPFKEKDGVRRGDLKDNLPHLLAAFYNAKETGELGLMKGQVKKVIFFESGFPVFALSNLVADRLGQFLVRAGKIDEQTLRQAADEASGSKRTGDVLIEMGALNEEERLYYVGQQIKSILYSVFAWEEGIFTLSFQARARKEAIKLDIHPANLIMRGVKKLYKP